MAVHRAWRRGSSNADRFSNRRRPAAAPKPGLCRARCVHSWLLRATHPLVHERTEIGKGRELRYVQLGRSISAPSNLSRSEPTPRGWSVRSAGHAGITDKVMDHKPVPDEQKDHCAQGRADEPRALIEPIPADHLADESRNESAGDAYQGRQDKSSWIVRPRRKHPRDKTGDEADDDNPYDVGHGQSPEMSCSIL
jgi:hypothetical protein